MLIPLLMILAGFVLLIWSADRLVLGASALARNLGISPLVIGLTIVGFGTSAPELVVSAIAALEGTPGLAVGNALGSNVANIGLILGITILIMPLKVQSGTLKREFPVLLLATTATLVLLLDGHISLTDGVLLFGSLIGISTWFVLSALKARVDNDPLLREIEEELPQSLPNGRAILWLVVGLILLPMSSQLLVTGASDMARMLGISDTIIGLTIVALGTSLPELAAAIASAMKKEDDLALGNILGSNLFNLLGVLGIAGMLHPLELNAFVLHRDYPVMFAFTIALALLAFTPGRQARRIPRLGGGMLLLAYLAYQGHLLWHVFFQESA